MNTKGLLMALALLMGMSTGVSAQGFLGRLKDRAVQTAKSTIESRVERKVYQETTGAVDDAFDGKLPGKGNKSKNAEEVEAVDEENPDAATSSDFKRGSVILFQDDVTAETVGEFPSKWDLLDGAAEVKTLGGQKAIEITNNGIITPLIKETGAYLPEQFTIEYDFYYWKSKNDIGLNDLKLCLANDADRSEWSGDGGSRCAFALVHGICDAGEHHVAYNNSMTNGNNRTSGFEYQFKQGWHHVALSFNKRAMKVYFDGKRVVNLPNVQQPTWLSFQVPFEYSNLTFIRNIVIAKGAVALYDRNEQSMTAVEKAIAETGKFVTNNILFKTGKADLLPESMAEIQKVADYMKKNPSVRFEVQGHTDNQGSDAVNDPLSQQRAESVVKALESLGCDGFNLRAVGKGSHEPVADNKTDAGRAKNRRVEFIKK
jgi:outer membrane protein OmpA-like peptidoglycan-associated protein